MKFYIRKFKDDFVNCNITITTSADGSFQMSWFKSIQSVSVEGQSQTIYPDVPTATGVITAEKILTEKKSNPASTHPHQLIACAAKDDDNTFIFADVLKYTNSTKGSIGFFKNSSNFINPIMYILVPFADAPISEWTFVAVATILTVDGNAVTETFDVDIDRTIADTCNATLPGIVLSKQGTTVSAQLVDATGSPIAKSNIDIYFETTAGYLTKSRSTTDTNGVATTEVVGAADGKIKAGFKYFTGKVDWII